MEKVLFVVDSSSQKPLIDDIKKWFSGKRFSEKFEMVFTDEDKACSVMDSDKGWAAVVFCSWEPNGGTLSTVQDVLRTFFGQSIACNQNEFVRKMLMAMKCGHACSPAELPALIGWLLLS
ncbi:MAG TPA: hypothetical protein PLK76_02655 [bacterium]|nr:hypothetical protein [bacterium]